MVFIEDLRHYQLFCYPQSSLPFVLLRSIIAHPAILAVFWYRYGNWAIHSFFGLRHISLLLYWLVFPFIRLVTGVQLLPQTNIGAGLVILHYGTTIINPRTTIGNQCVIYQEVLFASDDHQRCPIVGDRVLIGAKASIIGPVVIGSDSAIGVSSVVTKDIAPFSIAAGIPARIIRSRHEN
jgi:serine O-acetyltransferase